MTDRKEGWVDCPGNGCGDPLKVLVVDGVIVSWPAACPSCGTALHLPPEGVVTLDSDDPTAPRD